MERRDLAYLMVLLGNFLGRAKKYDEIFARIDGFWNLRTYYVKRSCYPSDSYVKFKGPKTCTVALNEWLFNLRCARIPLEVRDTLSGERRVGGGDV